MNDRTKTNDSEEYIDDDDRADAVIAADDTGMLSEERQITIVETVPHEDEGGT